MLNLPPVWLLFVLLLHIAAGFIALLSGLMPLFTLKGGREHRGWGRVFVWAMGLSSLTAFPLAFWRHNLFQAEVGVFTGYLTLFGLRVVQRRRVSSGVLDWGAAVVGGLVFAVFSAAGVLALLGHWPLPHAGMSVFFALLGLGMAGRDLHALVVRDFSRRRIVIDHMVALCLALLAGYSAFLNTQLNRMTGLSWSLEEKMSLPFVVGLPGLMVWAFLWERKLRLIPKRERAKRRRSVLKTTAPAQVFLAPEVRRLCGLAVAEGISFLLLLCVGVPLKHLLGIPQAVRLLGPIHGGLFILYVVAVFQAAPRLRWSGKQIMLALGAGVVPTATFFLEARLRKPAAAIGGNTLGGDTHGQAD